MGKKFIPNWKRASSRTTTQFSRRSKGSCDRGRAGCGAFRPLGRIQGKTSNLQRPTSNTQRNGMLRRRCGSPAIGFRASDVRGRTFCPCPARRVMGAWWPSRSSKPLSARSTGRGMFDSYPLRQLHLRLTIDDLRFEEPTRAASPADPVVNRKSQIVNLKKGGGLHDTRKNS